MNTLRSIIVLFFVSFTAFGQVPQGISYQAIAFNAGGTPVANSNVGVRISIMDNSTTGPVVYSESHVRLTNGQGLFNLNIGQGTPLSGTFSAINWAANSKFLKVEIDPAGGTNYTSAGTSQLMSVPYALYSESTNSENIPALANIASKNGTLIVVYTSTGGYGFTANSTGTPTWYSQGFSGTVLGAAATDSTILVYTSSSAYGFTLNASGNAGWYSQGISGTPLGIVTNAANGVVVYTSTGGYGFMTSSAGVPSWYNQGFSGTTIGGSSSGNLIVIYSSDSAYGFTRNASGTPGWYSQGISGTPIGIVPE
jgi:hypothetical protein